MLSQSIQQLKELQHRVNLNEQDVRELNIDI